MAQQSTQPRHNPGLAVIQGISRQIIALNPDDPESFTKAGYLIQKALDAFTTAAIEACDASDWQNKALAMFGIPGKGK
jgi:serine protease inhibitor ecotin